MHTYNVLGIFNDAQMFTMHNVTSDSDLRERLDNGFAYGYTSKDLLDYLVSPFANGTITSGMIDQLDNKHFPELV